MIETRLLTRPAAAWEQALAARGVPVGRVNDIREAFAQPQAVDRGMLVRFAEPGGREVFAAGNPIRFAGEAAPPQRPPVPKGADTVAILAALLGYPAARIEALQAAGAIG